LQREPQPAYAKAAARLPHSTNAVARLKIAAARRPYRDREGAGL